MKLELKHSLMFFSACGIIVILVYIATFIKMFLQHSS